MVEVENRDASTCGLDCGKKTHLQSIVSDTAEIIRKQSIHVTRYAMQTASCLTEIVPRGSGSLRPLAEPTSSGLCRNEPAQAESAYGPGSLDDGRQECP